MNTVKLAAADLQPLFDYLMQKFNLSKQQIEEAIEKTGTSSENLEQYFTTLVQQNDLNQKEKLPV